MQADNRLLTNLIKCEKEHHSALLGLLVRSHTSLAALSAYASTASPPVAQALRGCIQSFAAADEGLRGYAAALEGWKEELKEVKRVEDELKAVVKDKDILVGRLIKASKQKIPTSSIQAGPAPIPTNSPSSSSLSFSMQTSQPYQYTPTPHATQHINSKLAQAQRELQACEGHLTAKEAELSEVRRSAIAEGMARRCRAMADVGHVWRERGELGLGALHELSGQDAAPSHSISQQRHTRSQSPFSPTYSHGSRSASPSPGTYHSINGGYQHSHPLPALPERNSWHVEDSFQDGQGRRPLSSLEPSRRPISLVDPPRAPTLHRRPISSNELPALPDQVTFDIPPPHSIGHDTGEFIPLGRPVSRSGSGERWQDSSSEEGEYRVVENGARWQDEVDPEILRAVEKMGMVSKPKVDPEVSRNTPPTPPDTVSSSSPARLADLRVIESTPKGRGKAKGKKARRARRDEQGLDETVVLAPTPLPVEKALPRPTWDERVDISSESIDRPIMQPVPRALSPRASPGPARSSSPSPSPRSISPEPPHAASPRLASSLTPTLLPSPQPAPISSSEQTQVARAPVPAPRSPVSLDDATLGNGDPRGGDVIMPASGSAEGLVLSTTGLASVRSCEVRGHSELDARAGELDARAGELDTKATLETLETPSLSHVPSTLIQPKASTVFDTPRAHSTLLDAPPSPSTVFNTPKAPSTVFNTPKAPSTVFDTPRALPSEFNTPKAVPSNIHSPVPNVIHSPVPSVIHSPAPESVYETPLVIPADIPRVQYELGRSPRLETPRSLELDIPRSPRLQVPQSPQAPKSPQAQVPRFPQPETPKSPRPAPTGLITPMATGSNPKHLPASTSEPVIQDRSKPKRRTVSGDETPKRKKTVKKGHSRQSSAVESTRPELRGTEGRADLAAMLRDSDGSAPHVHFPAPTGIFVPSAPPPRPKPGALYLPSSGTTRSDVGPARGHHFEALPPPGRNRSGSVNGSTSFFGRVAGLFGRKKQPDGYLSAGAGQAWRTRTEGNITRTRDDSSEDEPQPKNLVTVTNVNSRLASVEPGSPKRALGRKLTKAEKGQTLRVGAPESPNRTRKPSITEEQIVPAKSKQSKSRSVDGASRKGSVRSNASEPHGRASSDAGRKVGKEPASLMAIVEGPGLVLPSELVSRQTESPARSQTLAVPPARVSPASTAAPRPVRATSPMPLKSALRNRTPSPLPPTNDAQPNLVVPASNVRAQSPRNSISESIYETGEEDFESATDGEDDRSDVTASGQTTISAPAPTQLVHSPGAALAAFKDNLQTSTAGAGSVSTAGPRSANSTRKSVRINPAPPQMSATPTATPGSELEEEPSWTPKADKHSSSGGWASRIGRGWEDSSDESIDEDYERIRNALATSSKHIEAVNRPTHRR